MCSVSEERSAAPATSSHRPRTGAGCRVRHPHAQAAGVHAVHVCAAALGRWLPSMLRGPHNMQPGQSLSWWSQCVQLATASACRARSQRTSASRRRGSTCRARCSLQVCILAACNLTHAHRLKNTCRWLLRCCSYVSAAAASARCKPAVHRVSLQSFDTTWLQSPSHWRLTAPSPSRRATAASGEPQGNQMEAWCWTPSPWHISQAAGH